MENAILKKEFGKLYDIVLDILYKADLAKVHSPDYTEYGPETGTILPQLRLCSTVEEVHAMIYREFCRWFTPSIAGNFDQYREPAEKIFAAYISHHPTTRFSP